MLTHAVCACETHVWVDERAPELLTGAPDLGSLVPFPLLWGSTDLPSWFLRTDMLASSLNVSFPL